MTPQKLTCHKTTQPANRVWLCVFIIIQTLTKNVNYPLFKNVSSVIFNPQKINYAKIQDKTNFIE